VAFQRRKSEPIGVKAPLPGFVEPALASSIAKVPSGARWIHEIKFDGYRVQIHLANEAVKIFTRRGHDWTHRFKKVIRCPGRENGPLLRNRKRSIGHNVLRMVEHGARMQQRVDVENVVVESGRRPHGLLHSLTMSDAARRATRGKLLKRKNQAALASI
jgi:hypothetical protein